MKKKVYLSLFLLIMFSISFVSAIDTQINVKTWPNHKISIFVIKTGETYFLLNSYHINADSTGQVSATYSGDESKIMITVKITKDGQTVMLNKFEDEFKAGSPIYLQVIPNKISSNYMELEKQKVQAENTTNSTINQTTQAINQQVPSNITNNETTEINSSQTQKITGVAILEDNGFQIPSFVWYILLGLVIIGIIIFGSLRIKNIREKQKTEHHGKIILKPKLYNDKNMNKQLAEAEKKIFEAQKELNQIKNRSKIDELKSRIQKEQDELSKLEKGSF